MPVRPVDPSRRAANRLAVAVLALLPAAIGLPAAAQQGGSFREGTCSGLLCDYIGGAQAPAAQQRSLFREGECGGVLCEAIGGSQAPKRSDPPPPCGGGLLCDMMPYKMGVPVTAAEAARRQEAERQAAIVPPVQAAPAAAASRRHRRKGAGTAAKDVASGSVGKQASKAAE